MRELDQPPAGGRTHQLMGPTCAGALRHAPGAHAGLGGERQRVVLGLRGAGAGGDASSQQALHVLQLRPCKQELRSNWSFSLRQFSNFYSF